MKFYLSSTLRDLYDERKIVKRIFEYMNQGGHKLITSETSSPEIFQQCLKDIDQCDVLILLLGVRYGTLFAHTDTGEELSMTHHEFRHARKNGKEIIAFQLKSDDYASQRSDEVARRESFWDEIKHCGIYASENIDGRFLGEVILATICVRYPEKRLVDFPTAEQPHLSHRLNPRVPQFISLIVQARDSGLRDANDLPLLNLIPEVQSWEPGSDSSDEDDLGYFNSDFPELTPCNNVQLSPETLTSNSGDSNRSLAGWLDCWYHQILNYAEQLRRKKRDGVDPKVIVELFLPRDLIFLMNSTALKLHSTSAIGGSQLVKSKDLVSSLNLVVRSLDRAETHVNNPSIAVNALLGRRLRSAWNSGDVLLVTSPPPSYGPDHHDGDCPWKTEFDDRTGYDSTAVCMYLAEFPSDQARMRELLDIIIDANLPLTLLWPCNSPRNAIPSDVRLKLAEEVLAKLSAQPLSLTPDKNGAFSQISTSLPKLNVETVACCRRETLILNRSLASAAKQAILLIDVNDHWPRLIARSVRDHPQERMISP
jgi:hypothetical protein